MPFNGKLSHRSCFFLALIQSHIAAFLVDPVSHDHIVSVPNELQDVALPATNKVASEAITRTERGIGQDQIRLVITGDSEYPETITYTEQHIWFAPDVNVSKTRIGTTTWLISHVLSNDIDGAAFPLDHNEAVASEQSIGKLFGSNDKEFDIRAPFAAVFETANLDMNLNGMVDDPYNDEGFLALLIGSPPSTPPTPVKFMNGTEYAKYVASLEPTS